LNIIPNPEIAIHELSKRWLEVNDYILLHVRDYRRVQSGTTQEVVHVLRPAEGLRLQIPTWNEGQILSWVFSTIDTLSDAIELAERLDRLILSEFCNILFCSMVSFILGY
jgi:hypothetical protein